MFVESDIERELKAAVMTGPTFSDKSQLQLERFVVGKHSSPGREYRQVLLELTQKLGTLKRSKICRTRTQAEIALLQGKLGVTKNEHRKVILQCDIDEKQIALDYEEKLIADAITECNILYAMFKKYPKLTAAEFEAGELEYWKQRLVLDAQLSIAATGTIDPGTAHALIDVGINPVQALIELRATNAVIEAKTQEKLKLAHEKTGE
ncbi:MAG: hypothetical protein ACREGB_04710 [Candidatus Saccharimonadales bacterium]